MNWLKINKIKIVFLLLSGIFSASYGQSTVSGTVMDIVTLIPIQDATVYINGTSIGTSTNQMGQFTLKDVVFPCKLIVSRIGYDLKTIDIAEFITEKQSIFLKEKIVQLSEVEVKGKSLREKSVERFKNLFLGSDSWGKKAVLENESALVFSRFSDTCKANTDTINALISKVDELNGTESDTVVKSRVISLFSVKAKAPLVVDYSDLGYKLYVDLADFQLIETKTTTLCKYSAYFYYKPYETKSKSAQRRFQKNRIEAFYDSRKHFCRSMFRDQLRQNGYLLIEYYINESTYDIEKRLVDLSQHMIYKNRNEIQLVGLKGRTFHIYDYFSDNKPIDLTNSKRFNLNSVPEFMSSAARYRSTSFRVFEKTTVSFTSDTCTVESTGIVPDVNILFSGKMIKKKVDSMIPDIYLKEY